MYELLLAVHLVAAVVWVGGSVALTILSTRFAPADRATVGPHFSWYGGVVMTAAAFVLLLAGIGLVIEVDGYEFGDLWIALAIAGWISSAIVGAGFLGPLGKKLQAAQSAEEAESAWSRLMTMQRLDTLIVVLVVVDMAVKPGA
jgi:putative copper export protein